MHFSNLDWFIFIAYLVLMAALGLYLSFKNKSETSEDYFLAGKSLPWWAIGASLIASNISAEQFIGMSGSGFKIGMAIASYEFMAAITLILVAWFMLPIFLKEGIFTLPQFIEKRFNKEVKTGLAVMWLFLFVFINITLVLYLGALTMGVALGTSLGLGILILALYSATFSIFGGLKTVVLTDIVQVVVLIFGGLLTTFLAVNAFSEGAGLWAGFQKLGVEASDKFNMILFKGELLYNNDNGVLVDAWEDLPGLSVLLGGMWIANIYYWGTNQYIIQRALGAKNISEARKGVVFAAFLKILLPLIVVVPGIVAFALHADVARGDQVYAWILNSYIPIGLKGICFAAVIAAVGSSISSIVNSVSTIFTIDIYQSYINKQASNAQMLSVGKITAAAALIIGAITAFVIPSPDQAFKSIQEFTGHFSPGILVVFLFGMFWKKASSKAAISVILISLPLSFILAYSFSSEVLPFMNRMVIVFVVLSVLMVAISFWSNGREADQKAIQLEPDTFKTTSTFKIISLVIVAILIAIYTMWW
jgi:SSS family solute:Na+ symporter